MYVLLFCVKRRSLTTSVQDRQNSAIARACAFGAALVLLAGFGFRWFSEYIGSTAARYA